MHCGGQHSVLQWRKDSSCLTSALIDKKDQVPLTCSEGFKKVGVDIVYLFIKGTLFSNLTAFFPQIPVAILDYNRLSSKGCMTILLKYTVLFKTDTHSSTNKRIASLFVHGTNHVQFKQNPII